LSRVFKQYIRSDEVVLIPDLPPPPLSSGEEEEGVSPARLALAEEQAAQLLRRAEEEAEKSKEEALACIQSEREAVLQAAAKEAGRIREEARREGFEQGSIEKKEEVEQGLRALGEAVAQLRKEHAAFLQECGQELKFLAADIAQKLVDQKIEEDDAILVGLVKQAVQSIREADWISVEISANLPQLAAALEKELGHEANGMRLEVVPRDLPDGGCWVQTSDGAVDASVATQIANLKTVFSHMDENEEN
jgi:flagellar biosynthesis/type III secretory pathway protein FliH